MNKIIYNNWKKNILSKRRVDWRTSLSGTEDALFSFSFNDTKHNNMHKNLERQVKDENYSERLTKKCFHTSTSSNTQAFFYFHFSFYLKFLL